jgi:hypothetical protein
MRTQFLAAIAAVMVATPLVTPLAAQAQDIPSYAQPAAVSDDEQINGRIVSFDGGYDLQVRDQRGYVDEVHLHQGTIINPTGLTLAQGMVVSIDGYNAGPYFAANEIDTPYTFYYGVPYYDGYPWNHWGASISLGFFFGHGGWWHGAGPYTWHGGIRVYDSPRRGYVGGYFHGRDFVAPRWHGGYYAHTNVHTSVHTNVHVNVHADVHGGGFHGGGFHGGGFHGGGHH